MLFLYDLKLFKKYNPWANKSEVTTVEGNNNCIIRTFIKYFLKYNSLLQNVCRAQTLNFISSGNTHFFILSVND